MAILAAATVLAFIPTAPAPGDLASLVVPRFPEGSIVLVAAILGWMPTGVDVSVWHSFWTLEKMSQLGERNEDQGLAARARRLGIALTDMRVGYLLSFFTGVMFLSLGAYHLSGRGDELSGMQFAEAISTAYTAILGRWMYHVFMLTAFFAMFSTSYTVIDGFSRSFSEGLTVLREDLAGEVARKRTYRGFVLASAALASTTILWIGNPVTLVVVVSLVSLTLAPVLYGLNIYCVRRDITDDALRPARATIVLGWLGIVLMVVALGVTVYVKLF